MLKCNVAVSGLNATDDPAPGIAFARSLRESGEWEGRIIGLAYDASDTGIYNGSFFDEVYLMPDPLLPAAFYDRLKKVHLKSRMNVIVPLLDYELLSLPALELYLREMGINMLIPSAPSLRQHLKTRLTSFCRQNNIKSPRQVQLVDPQNIAGAIEDLGLPAVVKGVIHGSCTAYSYSEALIHFNRIRERWGLAILVQEYIAGDEYNTDCLIDRDRKTIGAVQMKKLAVTEKGKGWAGVTVYDKELMDLSLDITARLGWIGPIELEFVRQRSTGDYYLLEINPRFGTWIYLSSRAGQNLPLAAVRIAMGERVKPFASYQTGIMFMRYSLDMVSPISVMAQVVNTGELITNEQDG